MKVFIITEGGKDKGFGHLVRSKALYQAFQEKGLKPDMVVDGDDSINSLVKDINCSIFNWLSEKEKLFNLISSADIAIVDSYLADSNFYKILSTKVKKAVYLDDNKRINYPKGVVINSAIYANEIDYLKNGEVSYLLGTKYSPLRKEFWNIPERKDKSSFDETLVTFGTGEHLSLLSKIEEILVGEFNLACKYINVNKNMLSADDVCKHMLDSKFCICGGGQTIYELARCGTPAIGICFADNQLVNLKKWDEKGFIKFAGWHNDKSLIKNIKEHIKVLSSDTGRSMGSVGTKHVDGKGALRIVEEILQ